jgi:hypothetical protein
MMDWTKLSREMLEITLSQYWRRLDSFNITPEKRTKAIAAIDAIQVELTRRGA